MAGGGRQRDDEPALRKDGKPYEGTGLGPIKAYPLTVNGEKMRIIRPIDYETAKDRGIIPQNGLSFDASDPDGIPAMGYRKFSPERIQIFLEKLSETGRMKLAAIYAGVVPATVETHRKADPHFDEMCRLALDMYHEMTIGLITAQARAGMVDRRFDKEGKVVYERVSYETQLRIKLMDRADPSYNAVSKQEVAVVGGAVVVPAPTDSVESWDDIVRRHTGGGAPAVASGPAALAEGRVVKRPVLDVPGVEAEGSEEPATE
jgi:hypothetical protein